MKNVYLLLLLLMAASMPGWAQETFPRNDVLDKRTHAYALTHAHIILNPTTEIENATLLVREGKIEGVGKDVTVPAGYTEIDLKGKYIYPSLIDMYSTYGLPKDPEGERRGRGRNEQFESKTPGAYNPNQAIRSEYNAAEAFVGDEKSAAAWRKMGFGTVLTFRADGVARGSGAVVALADERPNQVLLHPKVSAHYSFNKGSSTMDFPVSSMGQIALLRQTYLDANWYGAQEEAPFTDQSLDSWLELQDLPQIFEANNWLSVLRADKVGDEFGVQYIIKSGGDEYQRIAEVKATGASLIVPLNFPAAREVEDPFDAEQVSLQDMKHWELAPSNPAVLEKNGIAFALTTYGLKDKSAFWKNLRTAIKHGLSESTALAALTTQPAAMLNMEDQMGKLEAGLAANFIITSGKLFDAQTLIHENWVQGKRYALKDLETMDFAGSYELKVGTEVYALEVSGEPGKHKAHIQVNDSTEIKVNMKLDGEWTTLSFAPEKEAGTARLSGWWDEKGWQGKGQLAGGAWVDWQAMAQEGDSEEEATTQKEKPKKEKKQPDMGEVIYPFVAFGAQEVPQQETILIKNATVWTNEADGVLENTDVLIEDGKISKVGKNLKARNARTIDGTGKHLTSGIIDEHSHIAATSINDILVNSGMVRIGDVVDSEDIDIYRALAGGVTAVQVLHGSANPIGGQSALIKLRWGMGPEALKIQGADRFIKFALGENVKRSRSSNSIRYPQTRMGVEQVYRDAFTNAQEYENAWKAYNQPSASMAKPSVKPRLDLTHEAMRDIINGELFISCHSYVQSEINMLMAVAEDFDFRVNTFTHILEGYKLADKMKEHGVGGSTFSDWWNYKWEVRYAIPYNAAIMHREGVVTALNSDSGELMRRLNSEAAKPIKYGGLTEEEGLKMVTLNPAKLLHLEDRMGSIKVGKDGDVVVWSDHPLSIYAKAEQTIIDGTVYFDLERDAELRAYVQSERARLIQKMKDAKKNGASTIRKRSSYKIGYHCEDVLGYESEHAHEH